MRSKITHGDRNKWRKTAKVLLSKRYSSCINTAVVRIEDARFANGFCPKMAQNRTVRRAWESSGPLTVIRNLRSAPPPSLRVQSSRMTDHARQEIRAASACSGVVGEDEILLPIAVKSWPHLGCSSYARGCSRGEAAIALRPEHDRTIGGQIIIGR